VKKEMPGIGLTPGIFYFNFRARGFRNSVGHIFARNAVPETIHQPIT
jgi:hypothetical protein